MPNSPEREGSPRLLTIDQIAEKHGVSRSSVHTYRRGGTFPRPVPVEGTTRVLFDAEEVAAWFTANPKQQGKRTDVLAKKKQQQGDTMATPAPTTVDPRIALMSRLNTPPYDDVAGTYSTPLDEAAQLLDAYRAAVLLEAAKALELKFGLTPATIELRLMSTNAQKGAGVAGAEKPVENSPELLSASEPEPTDG